MTQENPNAYLEELVEEIVDSYSEQPSFLPNKSTIIEITEILRKLIFPGYFDQENTDYTYLKYYVGSLLIEVREKLQKQICRALQHDTAVSGRCVEDADLLSLRITKTFLKKIPGLRKLLLTDVDATRKEIPRPAIDMKSSLPIRASLPSASTEWPMSFFY
jgi:serine O-acetyltransferase